MKDLKKCLLFALNIVLITAFLPTQQTACSGDGKIEITNKGDIYSYPEFAIPRLGSYRFWVYWKQNFTSTITIIVRDRDTGDILRTEDIGEYSAIDKGQYTHELELSIPDDSKYVWNLEVEVRSDQGPSDKYSFSPIIAQPLQGATIMITNKDSISDFPKYVQFDQTQYNCEIRWFQSNDSEQTVVRTPDGDFILYNLTKGLYFHGWGSDLDYFFSGPPQDGRLISNERIIVADSNGAIDSYEWNVTLDATVHLRAMSEVAPYEPTSLEDIVVMFYSNYRNSTILRFEQASLARTSEFYNISTYYLKDPISGEGGFNPGRGYAFGSFFLSSNGKYTVKWGALDIDDVLAWYSDKNIVTVMNKASVSSPIESAISLYAPKKMYLYWAIVSEPVLSNEKIRLPGFELGAEIAYSFDKEFYYPGESGICFVQIKAVEYTPLEGIAVYVTSKFPSIQIIDPVVAERVRISRILNANQTIQIAIPFKVREDADPDFSRVILALALRDKDFEGVTRYAVMDRADAFAVKAAIFPTPIISIVSSWVQFTVLYPFISISTIAMISLAVSVGLLRKRAFRKHYVLLSTIQKVETELASNERYIKLPTYLRPTVAVMVAKSILSFQDLFANGFTDVASKSDEIYRNSTGLKGTYTAYQMPLELAMNTVNSVFTFVRDEVNIRIEEPFGEKVRWPWETLREGGDCDCKTVLLGSMLVHLGFEVEIAVIPRVDELKAAHCYTTVRLLDDGKTQWISLDPSDQRCAIGEISPVYEVYKDQEIRLSLLQMAINIGLQKG